MADKQQFAYIDGLSELFNPPPEAERASNAPPMNGARVPNRPLPIRSQPGSVSGRSPPVDLSSERNANVARSPAEPGIAKKLHAFGHSGTEFLDAMEKDIMEVIEQQKASMEENDQLLLIVDQPDFLLASTGVDSMDMAEWVTGLQQVGLIYEYNSLYKD